MSARETALRVLESVDDGARSDAALGRALADAPAMRPEDRSLATRIVYGVLAWRLRLDHTLTAFCGRPLERVDRPIVNVLRIGLYQLCFLDRVPVYAAVDSTVRTIPATLRRATGFVNAVLRRAAREGLAPIQQTGDERLAIELSHPEWLVRLWLAELGASEATALMRADNQSAPTVLRSLMDRRACIEALRTRGVESEPACHAPDALRASSPVALPGVALPQGEASQLVTLLVDPRPGERVLDACAAPGGKSAYLAALVGSTGSVTAVDPGTGASKRIGSVLATAGVQATIVEARLQDLPAGAPYDAVLVDAPCSGLGTLREHPEIRWRRRPEDLPRYADRQLDILRSAANLVRPGGRLVYATCTIARVENEEVVARFLVEHEGFAASDPGRLHAALRPMVDESCRLRTFPHRDDMAGFFAQSLTRRA